VSGPAHAVRNRFRKGGGTTVTWSTADVRLHTIGVVLPAHDEAGHVGAVIRTLPAWVDHVYVVDDMSGDDTADAARAVGDPRVTVITHERNTGVGGAMVTGYRAGLADGCDVIVKMDADGQMHPGDMELLVDPVVRGLADYAKGNRFYMVGGVKGMPAERKLGSAVLTFMTKAASGYWHMFDAQCGYTAVRSNYLEMIELDRVASDYFFENDMLIRMNAVGARVVDVPAATIYGDEVSDVRIGRVALTFPWRLLRGWARRVIRKYLVTDFGAVGLLLCAAAPLGVFGVVFGAARWAHSITTGQPASTGTVMIAVLPLIVGIQLAVQAFAMEVAESPGARETQRYLHELIVAGRLK
jgi:dolichol-phosphate mannosyltransferase